MPQYTIDPVDALTRYKTIAVVGASKNPEKDANTVPEFMMSHGYTIIPVNPTAETILGLKAYPSLETIPAELAAKIEMVDVFRPSEELPRVAKDVAELKMKTARPFVFWAQLGIENDEAKSILQAAGVDYVMDRCLRIEYRKMTGVF